MAEASWDVVRTLTLRLTEREAIVLQVIFSNIGGDPKGPRGLADDMRMALDELGISCDRNMRVTGVISFPA